MLQPGARNLITDVPGIAVGNAHDARLASGATVILGKQPMTAAVDVRGGGPGTRETDALASAATVQQVHAIVFSGGSAYGLDAATGVQSFLRELNIGFAIGAARVPIVPQAILFDLLNGGNKNWGRRPPYADLAYEACHAAAGEFSLGTTGAGYGATTESLKGGLGSASLVLNDGATVGALAAVNASGNVNIANGPNFWASPFERNGELGGLGFPAIMPVEASMPVTKKAPGESTVLALVATDVDLNRQGLQRLAIVAQTGLARAIYPAHTPLDGDVVFAVSTRQRKLSGGVAGFAELAAHTADVLARAIARGVFDAARGTGSHPPAYRDRFPE